MSQNEPEFKVGDKVKGLGMTGVVDAILEHGEYIVCVQWDTEQKNINYFFPDGRYFPEGEPCLELLERPKPKKKVTYYKVYYRNRHEKGANCIQGSVYYEVKETALKIYREFEIVEIEEKIFEIEE